MKKFLEKENKLSVLERISIGIAIIFSFGSFILSLQANQISKESNNKADKSNAIANQSNNLASEANNLSHVANLSNSEMNNYQKGQLSSTLVDKAYEEITTPEEMIAIQTKIDSDQNTKDISTLKRYVDIYENLGSKYCKGLIDKEYLRSSFFNKLNALCRNNQINQEFQNKKNATALLCFTFVPGSTFAKNFKEETLHTCKELIIKQ